VRPDRQNNRHTPFALTQQKISLWYYTITFLWVLLLLVAIVFALAPVFIEFLVAPRKRTLAKGDAYECGVKTYGETWIRFRIQYYIYAIMFVVFDIETVVSVSVGRELRGVRRLCAL